MTDQALDDLARRLLLDTATLGWNDEINDQTEHTFSRNFERKMKPVIQRADHPVRYYATRLLTALLLIAFLGGGSLLTFSAEARAAFFNWVIEWYDTQIIYRFSGEPAEDPFAPLPKYEITALPEGYEPFKDEIMIPGSYCIGYANADGDLLWFAYQRMEQGSALAIQEETEGMKAYDVTVNGLNGRVYCFPDVEQHNIIIWMDEENNLEFDISGFFDEDELLHIAESVFLCDAGK